MSNIDDGPIHGRVGDATTREIEAHVAHVADRGTVIGLRASLRAMKAERAIEAVTAGGAS